MCYSFVFMMTQITLYTKDGCHLCEDVMVLLGDLSADYPHTLTIIDIRTNRALHKKYLLTIPVLVIGHSELNAPIMRKQIITELSKLSDSTS